MFVVLAIVLLVTPFLNDSDNVEPLTGLPWQIEIYPDGSTQVFGLHLGVSRLADALGVLGDDDVDLAIIAATGETGSLEMYYAHYRAGVISGKLIIQTNASEQNIKGWRENAVTSDYMASGKAKKYKLSPDDLKQALHEVVTGVTFIPSVNLDEEIILARFGQPDKLIQLNGATHFLYQEKALDIAMFAEAKEVLQYVSSEQWPGYFKSIDEVDGQ